MDTTTKRAAAFDFAALRSGLSRIGTSILDGMVWLASIGPAMGALQRLSETSDEELAARGTSRAAEVQRIFGPRMGL